MIFWSFLAKSQVKCKSEIELLRPCSRMGQQIKEQTMGSAHAWKLVKSG